MPWLRLLVAGLLPRRPGLAPMSLRVGFVVDKVALRQVFLRFILLSVIVITPWLSVLTYHLGMSNRPVGGRNSET
jgi:hypothetical protein